MASASPLKNRFLAYFLVSVIYFSVKKFAALILLTLEGLLATAGHLCCWVMDSYVTILLTYIRINSGEVTATDLHLDTRQQNRLYEGRTVGRAACTELCTCCRKGYSPHYAGKMADSECYCTIAVIFFF